MRKFSVFRQLRCRPTLRNLLDVNGQRPTGRSVSAALQKPSVGALSSAQSLVSDKGYVKVPLLSDAPETFSLLWLRDHCPCPNCYSTSTFQRKFNVKNLFPQVAATSAEINGKTLHISWSDGHQSEYPMSWLKQNSFTAFSSRLASAYERRRAWHPRDFKSLPIARIPVEKLLGDNRQQFRKEAYESLWTFGVVFIENVAPNVPATRAAVEAIGPLMKSTWGEEPHVFEANDARSDSAYSTDYIGAHTDNTYFTEAAGLQALICFHHDGDGGENGLVDGLAVAQRFRELDPRGFEFFVRNPIPSEFREEREDLRHHFVSNDCVFKLDPLTQRHVVQIRYNIYDRAPLVSMPAEAADQFYKHYRTLGEVVDEMEAESWFKLGVGTLALFDNFRLMHARTAFTGRRVMASCYVPRADFLSGARTLGVIP